jgi:uncharacterized protein with PIN domain
LANAKTVLKKSQRNTTENVILEQKLEERGIGASKKSDVKLGRCPECGKILIRFSKEISIAICTCSSAVEVPLTVTITRQKYEEAKQLAKEYGWKGSTLQKLLAGLMEMAALER